MGDLPEDELTIRRQTPILMVEDNAMNREVMYLLLEELEYMPDIANDGLEAVQMVAAKDYDIVLMDVMMPAMDGYKATSEIKKLKGPLESPTIIAMTANAFKEDREKCLKAGMDDYIAKPINVELLEKLLHKYRKPDRSPTSGITMEPILKSKSDRVTKGESSAQRLHSGRGIKKVKTANKLVSNLKFFKRFDPATMEMLSEHVSDPNDFILELTNIFVKDAPKTLIRIKSNLESENYSQAAIAAHSLKGNCRMVGAMDLANICEHIDMSIRAGTKKNFSEELKKLEGDFLGVIEEIKLYQKSLTKG